MDLNQLNYFRVVAKMERITSAAEVLHITQPALSKAISRVEEYAGAPLFDRTKGKLRLNKYGMAFLKRVDGMFAELNAGLAEVQQLRMDEHRRISVAASFDNMMFILVERFFGEHPDIKLRFATLSVEEIEAGLLSGELDFAVTSGPIRNPKIRWSQVSKEEILLTVREGHPLFDRKSVSFAELSGYPLLCSAEGDDTRSLIDSCFAGAGATPNFVLESSELASRNNFSNAPAFAASFIPAHRYMHVRKAGLNNDMTAVRLTDPECTRPTGLCRRADVELSAEAQSFYDYTWKYFESMDEEVRAFINGTDVGGPEDEAAVANMREEMKKAEKFEKSP